MKLLLKVQPPPPPYLKLPETQANTPASQFTQNCPTANRFSTENQNAPDNTPNLSQLFKKRPDPKQKIPKSTAKRKSIYTPKSKSTAPESDAEATEIRTGRGKRRGEPINLGLDEDEGEESEEDEDSTEDEQSSECSKDPFDKTVEGDKMHPFDKTVNEAKEGDEAVTLDKAYKNGKIALDSRIQEGFNVIVSKSDKVRYTAECSGEHCTWKIHVSIIPDKLTWAIKTISGEHIQCHFLKCNPMATTKWVASKLEDELTANPGMPVQGIADLLMGKFGITVKKRTMYKTNPGSWALITWHSPYTDRLTYFKGMFVSFSAWTKGFLRGCRPIIGVDGCHLKGRFKGMLLSALSLDGNNNLFIIAYAIVGKETTESWSYFFRNLKMVFQRESCTKWHWTFISDRMKGVEKALSNVFPTTTRRICAQHLYTNFKEKWAGPGYHDLFWKAANTTSPFVFNKAMTGIARLSREAFAYLSNVPQQWSRHQFDPLTACDHNTSNFVESFNVVISDMRAKPILVLMEEIRQYQMNKIAEIIDIAEAMQPYDPTPYAKGIIKSNCSDSRHCRVIKAGGGEFEVVEGTTTAFPVNLKNESCLCGAWQADGAPRVAKASGAASAITSGTTMSSIRLPSNIMHPMPDKDQWREFQFPMIQPPLQERSTGRLARQRKRKPDEKKKKRGSRSTINRCSICKTIGHNARSCQGGPTAKKRRTDGASTSTNQPPI
ncbi:uncharacterized protein LOC141627670 [Silene latifolia]|uniref:uncharacterized protein LOC141627670 n=1 Tax=Silene latifolia TaxID=37657 RepID=UPI003D778C67